MNKIKSVVRKSMKIRESGRSSDYITPSFGYGCLFNCSYCYMKRHLPKGLTVANNPGDILTKINEHVYFYADVKKPNQTHKEYITYDISCNEDFALHAKHHNWKYIFEFFRDNPKALGTFATKTIPIKFLEFNPEKKIRIRFSLMPQNIADKLEPNTAKIIDRIKAVDAFVEAGYDVHVNYSPVIIYDGWEKDYEYLFNMMQDYVEYKDEVLAEVIFLTHNKDKHIYNLTNNIQGEELLWRPDIQETKTSSYGGKNLRYKIGFKSNSINKFKSIHNKVIPWNTIRYIF